MKKIVEYLIAYSLIILLKFRYRIKVEGLDKMTPKVLNRKGGIIFMPNHPAYFVDPIIVTLAVWPKFPIRPMIVEYMYYTPFVHRVMHFMNALPVPNFVTSSNSLKRKKSDQVVQTVIDDLKKGQNFLIYPAGKVKHTAKESLGGASAIQKILQEAPEANVVLVRTKGLWGSCFSRAIVSSAPALSHVFMESILVILKNLIFFTPRREVIVQLEPSPANFPREGSRLEINKYLENWYNLPDGLIPQKEKLPGDSLKLVSYSLWKNEFKPVLKNKAHEESDISLEKISQDIQDKVINKLALLKNCDPSEIKPYMTLASDLGLDSLDTADLITFLDDQFNVKGIPPNELNTVAKVMAIAAKQIIVSRADEEENTHISNWLKPRKKTRASIAEGRTIGEVFLNQCALSKNEIACADSIVGVQTYNQLKMRSILLATYIQKLPGKYIGLMLPASVAANLLVLACEIAGKIPLMVNWTVGPRHLESVVMLSDVKVVISSWAFLDRLENTDLKGIDDRIIMLEDIVRQLTLSDKLKAFITSKQSTEAILKKFHSDALTKDNIAVLLFTSGTESLPKGVPLSHDNILSNMRSALKTQEVYTDDIIFGILPPFHSFGFTISGILGLLSGIRVYYSPDPTNGKRLAKSFAHWHVTLLVGAPTFIRGILKAATPDEMKTLHLCITGAEKAPPELFELLENCGKTNCLIEGYGITECSPILTLNGLDGCPKGVGKPLPGIDMIIVHPETEVILPQGERGLILAKGSNVFHGYINPDILSPFTEINHERWYKTGDLGYFDPLGNLIISGRMKRFIKIAGEMISLSSIEEALLQVAVKNKWPTTDKGPMLAICAKEHPNEKAKIFLFSLHDINLDTVNEALKDSGFSNLVKVFQVKTIPEIPIMGTGKTNYRLLEGQYLN